MDGRGRNGRSLTRLVIYTNTRLCQIKNKLFCLLVWVSRKRARATTFAMFCSFHEI